MKDQLIDKYFTTLSKWLTDRGFVSDKRSWKLPYENGLQFYSFVKGDFRFEIRIHWNNQYPGMYNPIDITLLDCKKEYRGELLGFKGWMGQLHIIRFSKPISKTLFNELYKHYNL